MEETLQQYKRRTNRVIEALEQKIIQKEECINTLHEIVKKKTDLINKMQLASYTPKLVQDNIKILKDGTNE
jgi:hypothetical protein